MTSESSIIAGYCGTDDFGGKYPDPVSLTITLITDPFSISVVKTAPVPFLQGSIT